MVSLSGLTRYSSVAQLATWNPKQPDMSTFQHGGCPQLMVASITNKGNFGSGVSMMAVPDDSIFDAAKLSSAFLVVRGSCR